MDISRSIFALIFPKHHHMIGHSFLEAFRTMRPRQLINLDVWLKCACRHPMMHDCNKLNIYFLLVPCALGGERTLRGLLSADELVICHHSWTSLLPNFRFLGCRLFILLLLAKNSVVCWKLLISVRSLVFISVKMQIYRIVAFIARTQ